MILRKRKTFLKKRKTARWCNYGCLARKVLSDRYMSKPRAAKGEHAVLVSGCVTVGCPPGTARDCQGPPEADSRLSAREADSCWNNRSIRRRKAS